MRQVHSKRLSRSHQSWHAEMTRAVGLFCLVLLLAPGVIEAARGRGRRLPRAVPGTKRNATWCNQQIPGCSVCYEQKAPIAPGAQFPGMEQPPEAETVVRCTRCRASAYVYNKDNDNCDCAGGHGTAFANGTLITVDFFEPAPSTLSDTMVFPTGDSNSSSKNSGSTANQESGKQSGTAAAKPGGAAAGVSTASFAEATSSTRADAATQKRLQPARRRRFEAAMRAKGYNVRVSRRGIVVGEPKQASFSSVAGQVGVQVVTEQNLVCMACRGHSVSVEGLIGGSFCMPCKPGKSPDRAGRECVSNM